jgi:hypothetical protein
MAIAAPARIGAGSRTQPGAGPKPRQQRLTVVSPKSLQARVARRHSRAMISLAVLVVVGTLLLIAACQALVASQQVRIDNFQQAVSKSVASNQNLQLQRASLETPANILQLAQHKFGLVSPRVVTYLPPVDPGPSVAGSKASSGK